jgi:hypothetical protein
MFQLHEKKEHTLIPSGIDGEFDIKKTGDRRPSRSPETQVPPSFTLFHLEHRRSLEATDPWTQIAQALQPEPKA